MKLKNTYGCSVEVEHFIFSDGGILKEFGGSSLDRKKTLPKKLQPINEPTNEELQVELEKESFRLGEISAEMNNSIIPITEIKEKKLRQMSRHTKTKIRKKVISWSQVETNLYFLTLTFLNKIDDEKAVIILRKFLDNLKKRKKGFNYLWVAERQKKNILFPDNIHFHLIINKSLAIEQYKKYWIELQNKNNVFARDASFIPASAFDIKKIKSSNMFKLRNYITKYITKNEDAFNCQIWQCSKFISALYTDYYTTGLFLDKLKRITEVTEKTIEIQIGKETIKTKLHLSKLDEISVRLFDNMKNKNIEVLQQMNAIIYNN